MSRKCEEARLILSAGSNRNMLLKTEAKSKTSDETLLSFQRDKHWKVWSKQYRHYINETILTDLSQSSLKHPSTI